MIADWETNHLFISDRLEADEPTLVARLRSALKGIAIETIPNTNDIWCRDYMPVQIGDSEFCQFTYTPDYLHGFEHLITPPENCRLAFMTNYRREPIFLDVGNVVASRSQVILTEKVFKENPTIKRPHLRQRLAEVLKADCIFIPKEPYDPIGHSDGVARFISEGRVLVNDYSAIDPAYDIRVRTVLEKHGLEIETLPMFNEKKPTKNGIASAVGNYINFLRVGNVIVLPAYDRPEDQSALKKVRQALPEATVHQVSCRSLAEKGGVLNCISWPIKIPKEIRSGIP